MRSFPLACVLGIFALSAAAGAGLGAKDPPAVSSPTPTITRRPWATETPTPTATPIPPIILEIGPEVVSAYRIATDRIWHEGCGSINGVMGQEPDALVLARVAVGENPNSHDDRWYIMWLIRLRAELGFKNAGDYGGWRARSDRWGPRTSIKREALCDGGCQFAPVEATFGVYFPTAVKADNIRLMIWPSDEYLDRFDHAVRDAERILSLPLEAFPRELRGFDGFRAPSVTWIGRLDYEGGRRSHQFVPRGEIWLDQYPQDNEFWRGEEATSEILLPPTPSSATVDPKGE